MQTCDSHSAKLSSHNILAKAHVLEAMLIVHSYPGNTVASYVISSWAMVLSNACFLLPAQCKIRMRG